MKLLSLLLYFMFYHFITKGDIFYYFISNGWGQYLTCLLDGEEYILYIRKYGFSEKARM